MQPCTVNKATLYKKLQAPIPRRLRIKCLSSLLSMRRLRSIHAITSGTGNVLAIFNIGACHRVCKMGSDPFTSENRFVKNTNWRSVIKHEVGHVVANIYKLNPMEIAKDILYMEREIEVLEYLTDELSLYSTELEDGTEIISESFSGYYSNAGNNFADKYVKRCIEIIKEGGKQA